MVARRRRAGVHSGVHPAGPAAVLPFVVGGEHGVEVRGAGRGAGIDVDLGGSDARAGHVDRPGRHGRVERGDGRPGVVAAAKAVATGCQVRGERGTAQGTVAGGRPRDAADHGVVGHHALAGIVLVAEVVDDGVVRVEARMAQGRRRVEGLGGPGRLGDGVPADRPGQLSMERVELDAVFVALAGVGAHGASRLGVPQAAEVRLDAPRLQGEQRQELGDLDFNAILVGLVGEAGRLDARVGIAQRGVVPGGVGVPAHARHQDDPVAEQLGVIVQVIGAVPVLDLVVDRYGLGHVRRAVPLCSIEDRVEVVRALVVGARRSAAGLVLLLEQVGVSR